MQQKSNTITTGLAMFSMFFGAGNVVFPLALGVYAQDKNLFAILGLLISAVGIPFMGLIAMTLFNGDYKNFFERIGKIPGFVVAAAIMGLIGPFGAIPRCITLSYSTIKLYLPDLFITLPIFSVVACLIIFAFTLKRNNIIDILGYVLTPILLGSLAIIIVKGLFFSPQAPHLDYSHSKVFLLGLFEGYQTMDLLGAFFFSSVVLTCLENKGAPEKEHKNYKHLIFLTLKASCIGAFLLSLTYVGFSYLASFNSESLANVAKDELAGKIALLVLGPHAGLIAGIAVALACLTTAIALASVFAEFIHKDITFERINYGASLAITLIISFFVSTLNFTGIAQILAPILQICYPALIVLTAVNIGYKLYHFMPVKVPVFITFILSVLVYFW